MWKNLEKHSGLMYLLLLLVLCCVVSFPSYCADASQLEQEAELSQLSSSIKDRLINLKVESEVMKQQLNTLSENLKMSQQEQKKWEEQSMSLSNSLTAINEQLNESYVLIEQQKVQLKTRLKIVTVLAIILGTRILAMGLGFILYAKGIKLPRWLDILL